MEKLLQDLRYGLRGLLRRPAFTAVALLSLGLGIGANTAIFTLLAAVFLQPLPVADVSRLVVVFTLSSDYPGYNAVSQPNLADYRDLSGVFSDLAIVAPVTLSLSGGTRPEQLDGQLVSARYLDMLGVKPALGRNFLREEDRIARPVVILSHALWRRRFGGDPGIVGRVIRLNNHELAVVGVTPAGFYGTNFVTRSDFWVPAGLYREILPQFHSSLWNVRRSLLFGGEGRLRPGVSLHQAQAALQALSAHLAQEYPDANHNRSAVLVPLGQALISPNNRQGYVQAGGLLVTMVGLVLLIACANLANLLLVRASGRRQEIAIRLALGGRRSDLVRQLLAESVLLALGAGAAGLLLAVWAFGLMSSVHTPYLPAGLALGLDGRALAFTLALSLATTLLFGLVPALLASRPDLVPALKNETAEARRQGLLRHLGLRHLLIVGQVGLSVVALAGAVLFLLSLRNSQRTDPGFERGHLAVLSFDLDSLGLDEARGRQFLLQVTEQVAALPGVRSAAVGENLVLADQGTGHVLLVDSPAAPADRRVVALSNSVGPAYFATLGIPILRGRALDAGDRAGTRPVVVINDAMARRFWPAASPIGKRFTILPSKQVLEIVGVARDVKYNSLGEEPQPYIYQPEEQAYKPAVTLHVRTQGAPATVLAAVRRRVQAMAPEMPLTRVKTMPALIHELLWAPQVCAVLLTLFGAVALILVVIGIYSVIAHSIAQRQREIGIRMALGARRADVVGLFLRQGIQAVAVGLACGLAAALFAADAVADLLYGVDPRSPLVFAAITLLLAVVALIANYIPTRRATAVSPLTVIRAQ
jgi:putative ABC transport system permease protein